MHLIEGEDPREAIRVQEIEGLPQEIIMSTSDTKLFRGPRREVYAHYEGWLIRKLVPYAKRARSVVDLGCGYGFFLSLLKDALVRKVPLYGGDFSPAAVHLAQALNRNDEFFCVWPFDFLGNGRCIPLESADAPCLVFTSYAIHQLPTAQPAIDVLTFHRKKIGCVITFEPEEDYFGNTLLGLLRHRYGQVNGYSANTIRLLRERDDVEIERIIPNAMGVNALLPGTLCIWKFR
jgi:SAM-dependent methyltransferase